jgi:hypothetical protein
MVELEKIEEIADNEVTGSDAEREEEATEDNSAEREEAMKRGGKTGKAGDRDRVRRGRRS